ncbi:tail protein X [Paracoccus aminovorans]|nr:tail protein X [Paracoccus aminovorans]
MNQGLAELGPVLPLGTVVNMPVTISKDAAPSEARVKLW